MKRRLLILSLMLLLLALAAINPPSWSETEAGCVEISSLDFRDEVIEVSNRCAEPQDVSEWFILSIGDDSKIDQIFRFPGECGIGPHGKVSITSGAESLNLLNTNDACSLEPEEGTNTKLYWDVTGNENVWVNAGDTACLLNAERQLVDAREENDGRCEAVRGVSTID